MSQCICIIQEGQAADQKRAELSEGLGRIAADCFGEAPGEVVPAFVAVGEGYGWTAGAPSRSSIVIRSVPVGFSPAEREAFMNRVCDLWQDVTGCSLDEIVVTAWDGPLPIAPQD